MSRNYFRYNVSGGRFNLGCLVRGNSNKFNQNDIRVTSLDQIDCPVPFNENEELVSSILNIETRSEEQPLTVSEAFYCLYSEFHNVQTNLIPHKGLKNTNR